MRTVCLLGASGNIGTQSLDIFAKDPSSFRLIAISVGHQVNKIAGILKEFSSISYLCVEEEKDFNDLKKTYPQLHLYFGNEGLVSLIEECGAEMIENALVGFSGLVPSLTTLRLDKILCLANKESLVVGGELIERLLRKGKGRLYPIDSEHVALAKCLSSVNRDEVDSLILTASGGAFRKLSREELKDVTTEMALNHPTWKMGPKITIDSDTMFNKGFEVIEAHYLFNWPIDKIEILLHDESEVHSLIKLKDGTYVAEINKPDMHGPIAFALYETRVPLNLYKASKIEDFGDYHFHQFKGERYPAVGIALDASTRGGIAPCVLNAAVEEADGLFLNKKISFLEIEKIVKLALDAIPNIINPTLRDILSSDAYTRLFIKRYFARKD
jgi:1-deoxy-D-xylulose-5-phosphate reductoisomerase